MGGWVKTNGIPFWGRCTTHFRTYFSGAWDVHWGYDLGFHPWQHLTQESFFPSMLETSTYWTCGPMRWPGNLNALGAPPGLWEVNLPMRHAKEAACFSLVQSSVIPCPHQWIVQNDPTQCCTWHIWGSRPLSFQGSFLCPKPAI